MEVKEFFKKNNLIESELSPNSTILDSFRNFVYPVKELIIYFVAIFIFLLIIIIISKYSFYNNIKIELLDSDFTLFIYPLFFSIIFFLFYFFWPKKDDDWRKIKINKWFRSWRLYDLLTYLENIGVYFKGACEKESSFIVNFPNTKNDIYVDYIINLKLTTLGTISYDLFLFDYLLDIESRNEEKYNEYTRYFFFGIKNISFNNEEYHLYFYGRKRKSFDSHKLVYISKKDDNVFYKEDGENINGINAKDEIKLILDKYPSLKGEVIIKKNITYLVLYDTFKNIGFFNVDKGIKYNEFLDKETGKTGAIEGAYEILEYLLKTGSNIVQ
jgi:hypothetical protein